MCSQKSRRYLAEAIKKGVIDVHIIKCVISGIAGAGKTCLELLLLGKKPPKVRRSTGCAEPIRAVSGTRIQFIDGGWKVVSEEDLEEMIASYIPIFCDNFDEDIPAEELEALLQQQVFSDTLQDKAACTSQDESTPDSKENTTPNTQDKTSSSSSEAPQQATTSVLSDLIKRMNKIALPETTDSDNDTSDDESENLKDLSGSNWIHLIDSGGQPEFYDLLPIFIRHASSILFVQRLCDSLKDHPVVEFYDEEGNLVGTPYRYLLTCEEILKCMVRTLHSHRTEGKHSNIMVAGTFRDKESKCPETRAEKNKTIFNLLHPHFPNDLVLYGDAMEPIFPLNTKTPNKDDQRVAQLLREAIERSAPDPVKVPISWYLLELALRRLAALLKRRVLSRKECLVIARQLDFSEEEFNSALIYFDELNLCLHYPLVLRDVVFSDPQVLLDKASELVQHSYRLRGAKQGKQPQKPQACTALDAKWVKFRDQGLVRAEFLEKFPRHYKEGLFTPTDLIRLFESLLILAPLSVEEFFMPSLLQRLPSEELDEHRVFSPAVAPLLIRFPHGWPRSGVFCCLVVFLINHCKWQAVFSDTRSPILMAKNCIKFRIPRHPATVTLIDSYAYFEIHIKAPPPVCRKICPSIRDAIFDGIDEATVTLHYNNNEPCSSFFCPHSNSNGQASNSEPHAATTEDQEYWQCTMADHFGELTEREKVWFGSKDATAGVDTTGSLSGEQQQLLPSPSQGQMHMPHYEQYTPHSPYLKSVQGSPYHQPSHQHTHPWAHRQETFVAVPAPGMKPPYSAASTGTMSQLHSSTMAEGYVPHPEGGQQTQHSQLGYVPQQPYHHYPQHPSSFPVGPTQKCVEMIGPQSRQQQYHPQLQHPSFQGPSHQPGKLHSAPETRDLMNEVAAKIPDKWAEVAIGLGLDFTDIKRIKTDIPTPNSTTLYCAVFDTWKNKVTEEYTWNTVLKALRTPLVDARKLAEDIENQFLT